MPGNKIQVKHTSGKIMVKASTGKIIVAGSTDLCGCVPAGSCPFCDSGTPSKVSVTFAGITPNAAVGSCDTRGIVSPTASDKITLFNVNGTYCVPLCVTHTDVRGGCYYTKYETGIFSADYYAHDPTCAGAIDCTASTVWIGVTKGSSNQWFVDMQVYEPTHVPGDPCDNGFGNICTLDSYSLFHGLITMGVSYDCESTVVVNNVAIAANSNGFMGYGGTATIVPGGC